MPVRVITDSTSYIPRDQLDALGIRVVSLAVIYDGAPHREVEMDVPAFYEWLAHRRANRGRRLAQQLARARLRGARFVVPNTASSARHILALEVVGISDG